MWAANSILPGTWPQKILQNGTAPDGLPLAMPMGMFMTWNLTLPGSLYATGYFPANDSSGSSGLGKWDGESMDFHCRSKGINLLCEPRKIYKDGFFAGGYFENDTLIPGVGLRNGMVITGN